MLAVALVGVLALGAGMQLATGEANRAASVKPAAAAASSTKRVAATPRPLPIEVRGVHVTGALASLPGKLAEYVGYTKHGLNTIELDIKDEGGEVAFVPSAVPLARGSGAARAITARARQPVWPTAAAST